MSYYNQNQPPVGVPPPQGYPQEGYGKDSYPPQGYPAQGYPPQGYPPQYAGQPPQQQHSGGSSGMLQGWPGDSPIENVVGSRKCPLCHGGSEGVFGSLAALCCCCLLDACF